MRKVFPLLAAVILMAGCFSSKKVEIEEEEPYARSPRRVYENKIRYSVFAPFQHEGSFFSFYALAKKISGPDAKGFYRVQFTNGPKAGQEINTKNVLLKVRQANGAELRRGMVVLVNHWDPRTHDDNTPVDLWRKGVVHNLDKVKSGLVVLEFPFDKNDFMATKETYRLDNLWIVLDPPQKDPRVFL